MTDGGVPLERRLCVAPMMQKTDRHFRHLARLITPNARLTRSNRPIKSPADNSAR